MDWNGQIITTTGSYNQTLTNTAGCDSVHTLNVTIIPSPSVILNDTIICSGNSLNLNPIANNYNAVNWINSTHGT